MRFAGGAIHQPDPGAGNDSPGHIPDGTRNLAPAALRASDVFKRNPDRIAAAWHAPRVFQ